MKRTLGYALAAFAALSIVYAVIQERRPASSPKPSKPAVDSPIVVARYCHGNARCSNCIKIEEYSREALEKALASGRLRFETVNIDEPANRHFVQDYGLYTKSLVLVDQTGRHKVLNGVWDHLDDKNAFIAYVKAETENFLK
ncbi:MAG TPA: hypothetical protein DCM05_04120 [Elusimicrobia bacterium]|nr:hypothetical protein [Elusimicrobiota bacterium]